MASVPESVMRPPSQPTSWEWRLAVPLAREAENAAEETV
jgi:hypothetical protein